MASAKAPQGTETQIRAIVFKEGDIYVAQCLEYDIATQAAEIEVLLNRLDLTVEAEFAICEAEGKEPRDCIPPAPQYYHSLWDKRSVALTHVNVAPTAFALDVAMAKAA